MASVPSGLTPIRKNRSLLLLLAGVALGNLPLMAPYLVSLWQLPQNRSCFGVLLIFAWLVKSRAEWRAIPIVSRVEHLGLPTLGLAIAIGIAGTVVGSSWLATLSFVTAVGGILLMIQGWVRIENSLGVWALLCVVLAPPLLGTEVASQLQLISAKIAASMLELTGAYTTVDGSSLQLADRQILFSGIFSTVFSLMAVVLACLTIAVLCKRPIVHTLLLTGSAILWGAILNALQLFTVAAAHTHYQVDLLSGWSHGVLGLVLFLVTIVACASTDSLLMLFLGPVSDKQ